MIRRVIVLGICIGLFGSSAPHVVRAAAAPTSVPNTVGQLHKIMTVLLAATPTYFRSLRAGVKQTGGEEIDFKNAAAFSKICPGCTIADEYATANTDERFAVTGNWPLPLRMTLAQKAAFVAKNFAPFAKGYANTHGKNSDGELWFDWRKGSPSTFLHLETYHSKSSSGIEVRVGHYLAVSANYVKWTRLTDDQRTDLSSGVEQLVTAGTLAGADNFSTLRGAATDTDNNYFHVNQTFGTVLTECDVDGIFANEGSSGGTGKWILECQTPDLGGTKAANLELIRAAVVTALPSGFTPPRIPNTWAPTTIAGIAARIRSPLKSGPTITATARSRITFKSSTSPRNPERPRDSVGNAQARASVQDICAIRHLSQEARRLFRLFFIAAAHAANRS